MNKIILIDDNSKNQRELYNASFVDREEYADCLYHIEKLNSNTDFSFLDDARCILLHDSLDDYIDTKFVPGSRIAKERIIEKIKNCGIPHVYFSDGHPLVGEWDPANPNQVKNIKKSEFYSNLKPFLDLYREGLFDLRAIAYGEQYEKKELTILLQRIIESLSCYRDKDTLTKSMIDEAVCEQFMEKVKLVSTLNYSKIEDGIITEKFKVGQFRTLLNTLANRAIRYTTITPKNNIILLGNSNSEVKLSGTANITYKNLKAFTLGEKGETELFEHIFSSISDSVDGIIIDVDATGDPCFCLSYALAIRLSLFEIKKAALAPIILMSDMTPEIYKNDHYAPLLQTKGISFETSSYTPSAIGMMNFISPKEYQQSFLDLIKVQPNATEGRHSIANQWGADVLSRMTIGNETNNELIKKTRLSLYFKYIRVLSLNLSDINNLINGFETTCAPSSNRTINATNKKILLIDDEAEKGWEDVLKQILSQPIVFKTLPKQISDFEQLPDEIKVKIEDGYFDLIFLDLRLNGLAEEENLDPDNFSGIKILRTIKDKNRGNQVIMFTASNKAWNMKKALDDADGYYIKESPEYNFSTSYSESNANELIECIQQCFNNGYLRDVYKKIKKIKELIQSSNCFLERTDEILGSIDMAYDLLAKSNTKQEYKAYSYLQLFLIIEEYVKIPTLYDTSEDGLYLYKGGQRYRLLKDKKAKNNIFTYNSAIVMKNGTGHYTLEKGTYEGRFIDTNYLVSALLIFKYGEVNSAAFQWTKIYKVRNNGCAHPKDAIINNDDFVRILQFMLLLFDESKANWRDISDAFPDISPDEQLALLRAKFNNK